MMRIKSVDDQAALEAVLPEIRAIGKKYGVSRIVLFGSRARGDCHMKSDIDLAVSTEVDPYARARLLLEFDDMRTLLKVDVIFMKQDMNPELRQNIEKEGIVLYE